MRKKIYCEIVVCDVCQKTLGDGDDYIPHFKAEAEAEIAEYKANCEWWTTPGGAEVCFGCSPGPDDFCTKCSHPYNDHELLDEPCMEDGCKCDRFYWEPEPKP